MNNLTQCFKWLMLFIACLLASAFSPKSLKDSLKTRFMDPPDSAKPGVYWYFMDGNTTREAITADLESMKKAGIGYALYLEVNLGIPRGKVDFLSNEWQNLYAHAVRESERLGIKIILGSGPGWAGSGGPWVKPEQSMMHLVSSSQNVNGPTKFRTILAKPIPRNPFFGEECLTKELKEVRDSWYEDVAILAFPTPKVNQVIIDVDEKALYYRAPYTSQPSVKQFITSSASYQEVPESAISQSAIIDLTSKLQPDGTLQWEVPEGKWTIMRFGKRNNGAVTRPAPFPGLGFECDKFDSVAFDAHFETYVGKLINKVGSSVKKGNGGWTMIHIDSWEMGSQNWTGDFRKQFKKRRGYDPLFFLPAYSGKIVGSLEQSERFLWDVRITAQELVIENHAGRFKELGRRHSLSLSIEPYDMNPTADLDLGSVADIPMCEFWTDKFGFNSAFSCIEATSIAHIQGKPIVAAESFTAESSEAWKKYPGNMKDQTDWAFCMGINRIMFHTFAHKPYGDNLKPGVVMGPYGVHWDRGQTWWSMVPEYHKYISRCQFLLSQGSTVSDILYLTPEGAPQVFRAPESALEGTDVLPDKRSYSFDGCSPLLLKNAEVSNNCIVFPGGASYRILVLPDIQTMTPELLTKISALVKAGATVIGNPPSKSPSLVNFPACDKMVQSLATELWSSNKIHPSNATLTTRQNSAGQFSTELYSNYDSTTSILRRLGVEADFTASGSIRYTHRSLPDREVYFISNRTNLPVEDWCKFREGTIYAELWDALTGEIRTLSNLFQTRGGISINLKLLPSQSFFVVFYKNPHPILKSASVKGNFPDNKLLFALTGSWIVNFDRTWGGPEKVVFDSLIDWTTRPEDGIRYYSGIATYVKKFDLPVSVKSLKKSELYLNLGSVKNMARVRLNGKDLGVVWTIPWHVNISGAVKPKENLLEIEIANLWANRLIGDESLPDDGIKDGKWPDWLLNRTPRTSGRFTFTTHQFYKKEDQLLESGLLGPVEIYRE